jgi:hypothetical protein
MVGLRRTGFPPVFPATGGKLQEEGAMHYYVLELADPERGIRELVIAEIAAMPGAQAQKFRETAVGKPRPQQLGSKWGACLLCTRQELRASKQGRRALRHWRRFDDSQFEERVRLYLS